MGAELHYMRTDTHDEANSSFSHFLRNRLKMYRRLKQRKLASQGNNCLIQSKHRGCQTGRRFPRGEAPSCSRYICYRVTKETLDKT